MTDDDLRARLRAGDPASALPPADPARVARLLEDTMTDDLTDLSGQADESRADGLRGRSRTTWTVAAVAVAALVVGTGLTLKMIGDDGGTVPTAGDTASVPAAPGSPSTGDDGGPEETVTDLTAGGAATSGRCLTPAAAPQVVAGQDTVVDATVESVSGGTVTLRPTRFYAGDPTDLVVVQAPGPELEALLSAVRFEEGGRYLVAATDGRVTLCGFTDRWSQELADVYATAFPD